MSNTRYPCYRYGISGGQLESKVIHSAEEEQEGWVSNPHPFRATSVAEFIHNGKNASEAQRLHKRELRRVEFLFAGHSLEDAEAMADAPEGAPVAAAPAPAPRAETELAEQNKTLQERLATQEISHQELIGHVVAQFDAKWKEASDELERLKAENATLLAERDAVKAENAALKAKKAGPKGAEAA